MTLTLRFSFGILLMALSLMAAKAHAEETTPSFEIYGFAMGDYIQDFKRVNPAWEDTLRPSKIPTSAGLYGSDGQALLSAKQSRFGEQSSLLVDGTALKTKLEFDFFGVGPDEGQTTIRLRHAYGEWGQWLGGQTHSLFMDIDAFPNVIDYWGPCGMVFLRLPQLRWTPVNTDDLSLAVAIERPLNDVDPGLLREIDPDFGGDVEADEKLPDFTAQIKKKGPWGHVQLAGILRKLGYDTLGTPNNIPNGSTFGWGLDLTTNFIFMEKDKLIVGGVYGHGIASYMNDGGVDLATDGSPGNVSASAVPLFGLELYYDHYWNERFASSVGYSRTQVSNTSLQAGSAFHWGEYASANLLYMPTKDVLMGVEALWGDRKDNDGNIGTDVRAQVSFKYSFASANIAKPI